ncbi:Alpha/Beta hydrolase protein [Xylariaceae sp. FL1019]|nr:Alpha/Beta hydrolase protein [Xylariaceae sp. FL1019]
MSQATRIGCKQSSGSLQASGLEGKFKLNIIQYTYQCPFYGKEETGESQFMISLRFNLVHYCEKQKTGVQQFDVDLIKSRPLVFFLCGGPGVGNSMDKYLEMILILLDLGYLVVFPDYRGTGDSQAEVMEKFDELLGVRNYSKVAEMSLRLLQGDIARDLENVRLVAQGNGIPWAFGGQSFGTWGQSSYHSLFPEGKIRMYSAGGLPPIQIPIDDVFKTLFVGVKDANDEYYKKYREDIKRVKRIAKFLLDKESKKETQAARDTGDLTARRFLCLGRSLSNSSVFFPKLHTLIQAMITDIESGRKELSDQSLQLYLKADSWKFDERPFYAILSERQYCSFKGWVSKWAAYRIAQTRHEFKWVGYDEPEAMLNYFDVADDEPLYFSGEMIYPWFFDVYAALRKWKQVAEIVAHMPQKVDMYNMDAFKANTTPWTAVCGNKDMCVNIADSKKLANEIPSITFKEVDGWEHAAIRTHQRQMMKEWGIGPPVMG